MEREESVSSVKRNHWPVKQDGQESLLHAARFEERRKFLTKSYYIVLSTRKYSWSFGTKLRPVRVTVIIQAITAVSLERGLQCLIVLFEEDLHSDVHRLKRV